VYLGDEGGIACSFALSGGKTVVVTSITHLRIDLDHPLLRRIQAYQLRRTQRLGRPASRRSRGSRRSLAKHQKARVAPHEESKKDELVLRFRAACDFWRSGEYERAAGSFREVLQRDRDDPHFSRYWLASCLFLLGSSDELDELLKQHDDDSGIWRFAQALHAFRLHGDIEEAQRILVEAHHLEPGFEHYLLRDKVVDARRDVQFDAAQAEWAFACARLFLPAWRSAPGAAAWARRILKVPPTVDEPDEVPRRFPLDELRDLPLRRET